MLNITYTFSDGKLQQWSLNTCLNLYTWGKCCLSKLTCTTRCQPQWWISMWEKVSVKGKGWSVSQRTANCPLQSDIFSRVFSCLKRERLIPIQSHGISAIKQWLTHHHATRTAVLLHHCILFLLGAPLEEGEWASNLHDSHYDRELGTKAATLPASKVFGRFWLESVSRQSICLLTYTAHPFCWLKSSWQSWILVWRVPHKSSNSRNLRLVCPKWMSLLFLNELFNLNSTEVEQTEARPLPGSPVVVYLRLPLHHQPLVLPLWM